MADLHLGARLLEWGDHAARRTEEIQRAWEEAVNTAVDRRVQAVLVAGDLFDRPDPEPAEHELVTRGLERWKEAGIAAIFLPGVYDGLYSLRSLYRPGRLPAWTTVVNWAEARRTAIPLGEETLQLHARALTVGREEAPLWAETDREAAPGVHVGLAHAVFEAETGPAAWSLPVVDEGQVAASGLDLLVVGGCHRFSRTLLGGTTVVTPGSPVGLHPGEWGARSWTLVEAGSGRMELERIERRVSPVVHTTVDLDAEGIRTPKSLAARLEAGRGEAALLSVRLVGEAARKWDPEDLAKEVARLPFAVHWDETDPVPEDREELHELFNRELEARSPEDDAALLEAARRYGLGRLAGVRNRVD